MITYEAPGERAQLFLVADISDILLVRNNTLTPHERSSSVVKVRARVHLLGVLFHSDASRS